MPLSIGTPPAQPKRTWKQILTGTVLAALLGTIITSPLFALFIVEESIQVAGFGIFMSSSYKDYDEMEIALEHYKTILDRGKQIAMFPVPVISLVQAYFLYFDAAYGYWKISSSSLEYKMSQTTATTGPTVYYRVCEKYSFEYKVEELKTDTKASEVQALIDKYLGDGWSIESTWTKVVGKTYYRVYLFQKITIEQKRVPTDQSCPT